jgi:hypothetical protein
MPDHREHGEPAPVVGIFDLLRAGTGKIHVHLASPVAQAFNSWFPGFFIIR